MEPQPGFLEGLRRLADEHGFLLIFHEMITGCDGQRAVRKRYMASFLTSPHGKSVGHIVPQVHHGLVLTGLGGMVSGLQEEEWSLVYKKTRDSSRFIDRTASHVVRSSGSQPIWRAATRETWSSSTDWRQAIHSAMAMLSTLGYSDEDIPPRYRRALRGELLRD